VGRDGKDGAYFGRTVSYHVERHFGTSTESVHYYPRHPLLDQEDRLPFRKTLTSEGKERVTKLELLESRPVHPQYILKISLMTPVVEEPDTTAPFPVGR
jgi:hypothetical protein